MNHAVMPTYGRTDVQFVRGEGAWLIDEQGERYLDALSGLGVVALGHANSAVADALSAQSQALLHTSNLYRIPLQERLAERLASISGMDNMFFANSGAEACECAIKIARLYGHTKQYTEPTIIVAESAFHGRTMATLTATGNRKVHAGFEPLVPGFLRVPYNDINSIEKIAANNNQVVAVFVEPIQGEGGIQIPDPDYLKGLRAICDANDWFLIIDEVQSGNARTGKYFCYQHSDILPDLVTTAKGLGNGVPIGVCLARGKAASLFQPGNHGSTFGGNPLSCAAANAVLDEFERLDIVNHAASMGTYLLDRFNKALLGDNRVKEIRGKGLMLGIELTSPCPDMTQRAFDQKLLINVTADSVIRLLPPLIINQEEADRIVDTICELIKQS
ncbi:MAG: aspartate aminotransferase family protein [Gammaproteobacteria bacterium TMED95]|nr:aspartate aminotransferase family protein [Gammaproteobacteria bacterium]OUV20588.1 MAG: aspartate aminotransferase family protein [Gammaproteobacteria bacterium TMED95]|tara:strand:- start:32 stop:1198 length:1167 start_codon:yes stop_codon:yes gene_type:complete